MRIRLQDVAALADVSEATVSRVMNHKPGVGPATKAAVIKVLADLGYEPPSLQASPRAGSIGLIVPELDNPVFPAFAQAIESRLLASGYMSILCCAGRAGASEDDYVEMLVNKGVEGMIVVSGRCSEIGGDHDIYRRLEADGMPLVLINGEVPGERIPTVSSDDRQASMTASDHLAALGHERIGLIVGPVCYLPVVRKIEGFRAAALRRGADPDTIDQRISESMFTLEGGYSAMGQLLEQGVTGVVAASDMMALGAIRAVRERGLTVPGDVSIVGYDDTNLMRFTDPPLTTIRQPVGRIAKHAVSLLLAQITGTRVERDVYLVEGELIGRGTTALCTNVVTHA